MQIKLTHADPHVGDVAVFDIVTGDTVSRTVEIRMHQSEVIDVHAGMSIVFVSDRERVRRAEEAGLPAPEASRPREWMRPPDAVPQPLTPGGVPTEPVVAAPADERPTSGTEPEGPGA